MSLTLLQGALQLLLHLDVEMIENKIVSCLRTHQGEIETCAPNNNQNKCVAYSNDLVI